MKLRHKDCEETVADLLADMVQEGLSDLPPDEQDRLIAAFIETISEPLGTQATVAESPSLVQDRREVHEPASQG